MAKFNVKVYYHTNVSVEVEAETEEEAIELGRQKAAMDSKEIVDQILEGLVEDADPDAEKIAE